MATKTDLNDVATFIHVVDAGGFSAAARRLRSAKSSISRGVARLEHALATRLLQRSSRAFALTEAGKDYYARASAALAALESANVATTNQQEIPRGPIRFATLTDVGAEVLPRLVAAFTMRHPEVRIDLDLSSRAVDLIKDGYDIAVTTGRQRDSSVVRRKLQEIAFRLYASPKYLARRRAPQTTADLTSHDCVLFHADNGRSRWRLLDKEVTVTGSITANDLSFLRRAAIEGAGIALLPEIVGAACVATGELTPVMPEHFAPGPPLFLVYPSRQHLPLRVKAFRDFLLEQFPQSHQRR